MDRELRRFELPVTQEFLPNVLGHANEWSSEPVGITADLTQIKDILHDLLPGQGQVSPAERATWDRELAGPLHRSLAHLPHRVAADMRFWHHMCIVELPEFVWFRWFGARPEVPRPEMLTPSLSERFLGSRSLRGVSRNALARLWWCAETLYSEGEGYTLVREALVNQDFFQAIFERQFGLYPPAARACLRSLKNATEGERREATRRLNHYLTTIELEALTEEDVVALLS